MEAIGIEPLWSVVVTRPHQEARAVSHLTRQGYQSYWPRTLTRNERVVPLFPRYVFVGLAERWYSLLGTFGISCVLFSGERPAIVNDQVIAGIRAMERNGLVALPKPDEYQFAINQRVKIISGHFAGCIGLYQGQSTKQRESILLSTLGRVELPAGNLEAVVD
jgi:transcriptional antiterminator RfaH